MNGNRNRMPVRGYQMGGAPGMEQLDSIMMTGGPADVPMSSPPPPPPAGGMPSMGEDPMVALMGNEAALGGGGMERGMPQEGMSLEEDAMALTEAVVGRTEGDVNAAVQILDTAKAMLLSASEQTSMQEPMMAASGGPLKPVPEGNKGLGKLPQGVRNQIGFMSGGGAMRRGDQNSVGMYQDGGPMYKQDGGVMYKAGGGSLTQQEILEKIREYQRS